MYGKLSLWIIYDLVMDSEFYMRFNILSTKTEFTPAEHV